MRKRKHKKFIVKCWSRYTDWHSESTWSIYSTAIDFKQRMEKSGFKCLLSVR